MKVVDFDGTVLDATFSVHGEDGVVSIVFESSGGREGGPNPRNLQYRRGQHVLLERLMEMGATITEIRVETDRTRMLPTEQQRVAISGRPYPIQLAPSDDADSLRRDISRYARKVGQTAENAEAPGGSSRRLRLFVSNVSGDWPDLEQHLAGNGGDADATTIEAVVELAGRRSRKGGQGFLISQSMRRAIEKHAVGLAELHYTTEGWEVTDVGTTESYDLECLRGSECLHVEVKGTTTDGDEILLTPNEVAHAGEQFPNVELFLVSGVVVDRRDPDDPVASGGVARVWREWRVDADRLRPIGYFFKVDPDRAVSGDSPP